MSWPLYNHAGQVMRWPIRRAKAHRVSRAHRACHKGQESDLGESTEGGAKTKAFKWSEKQRVPLKWHVHSVSRASQLDLPRGDELPGLWEARMILCRRVGTFKKGGESCLKGRELSHFAWRQDSALASEAGASQTRAQKAQGSNEPHLHICFTLAAKTWTRSGRANPN